MTNPLRFITACFCIVALITQSGCATAPRPYLPEEIRAQLGTVAIVPAGFRPESDLSVPAKGWLAGAGRKSARWAGKGTLGTLSGVQACNGDGSGLCAFLVLALSVTAGTIGGLAGGVTGAVQAESSDKVNLAEEVITTVIDSLNMQESLCEEVALQTREQGHTHVTVITDQGPAVPDATNFYSSIASEGIDSILVVAIPRFALAGEWDINPPLQFQMDAHIRLIRTADNVLLHETTFTHNGGIRTFYEWSDNNAQAFIEELNKSYLLLAERIVGEVFLLDPQEAP